MTSVNYETIYSLFLGSITDYKLASLNEDDAKTLMNEFLHKSLADSYLSHLFSSFTLDDDAETFSFTLAYVTSNDETEFVCNAVAKWMIYEWLHSQVRSVVNTAQFFGGAEQKFFSQSNHMSELRAMQDDAYSEARRFIQDRGWIHNSYLGGS